MTPLEILKAPYDYVQAETVISDVQKLLGIDDIPSGTGPTSIIIAGEKIGTANLLRLKGLGKHVWKGIDAQDYINKLRDEWDK